MKKTLCLFFALTMLAISPVAAQVTQFQTELDESFVILGGVQGTDSNATAVANFTLTQDPADPSATTLTYDIQFENVDLDGSQTPSVLDNITALHLHDTTRCAPNVPQCIAGTDTAGTIHVLNIFGLPRNDDADVMVDPVASTISGIWDVSDTSAPGTMAPTLSIADPAVIDLLMNEQVALFVHTNEIPSAASGGMLRLVPEPGTMALSLSGLLLMLAVVRRRK